MMLFEIMRTLGGALLGMFSAHLATSPVPSNRTKMPGGCPSSEWMGRLGQVSKGGSGRRAQGRTARTHEGPVEVPSLNGTGFDRMIAFDVFRRANRRGIRPVCACFRRLGARCRRSKGHVGTIGAFNRKSTDACRSAAGGRLAGGPRMSWGGTRAGKAPGEAGGSAPLPGFNPRAGL